MEMLFAIVLSFLALQANAEVKPPGSVVVNSCAQNVQALTQVQVCYASVVGLPNSYVWIGNDIWVFTDKVTLDHVGTVVSGRIQYRITNARRLAQLTRLDGDAVKITSRDETILVSDFQIMF